MASTILSDNGVSSGSAGLKTTAASDGALALQTTTAGGTATTALTIDTSQNVGIGTTSPVTSLTLAGTFAFSGNRALNWNTYFNSGDKYIANGYALQMYYDPSVGTLRFLNASNNSSGAGASASLVDRVAIDSSGNVGIGTTNPGVKLQVAMPSDGSNGVIFRYTGGTNNPGFFFNVNESTTVCSINASGSTGGILALATNGSEAARISGSNLLVGATITQGGGASVFTINSNVFNPLQIQNSHASSPYGAYINFSGSAPNGTGNYFLLMSDTGGLRAKFVSNGGLYNYSANNSNLSDAREKKNIELAPNYLNKICQIPVKTFLLKDQTDTDLNLGVIAQDVQAVCPELVTESDWADKGEEPKMRLSIYQTDLQYALMKSIQELKAINDQQAETINALTARVVALEGKA